MSVQLLNIGGVRVPIAYSIARCTERTVSALCHAGSASVGGTGMEGRVNHKVRCTCQLLGLAINESFDPLQPNTRVGCFYETTYSTIINFFNNACPSNVPHLPE